MLYKKIINALWLNIIFLFHAHGLEQINVLNLNKKIEIVRKECIDHYKNFYLSLEQFTETKNLFPKKIHDLITVDSNFSTKGPGLLKLIEDLHEKKQELQASENTEQKNTAQLMTFTLDKINEFFGLKLHCLLCFINDNKINTGSAFKGFFSLQNYSFEDEESIKHPFHQLLTEIAITTMTIKFSKLAYQVKKETLIYNLEQIKKKLFNLNKNLGSKTVNEQEIVEFINILEHATIKEPIVSSDKINFFAKSAIIILLAGGLVGYALNKEAPRWVNEKINQAFEDTKNFLGPTYVGEHAINKMEEKAAEIIQRATLATAALERTMPLVQQSLTDVQRSFDNVTRIITPLNDPNSPMSIIFTGLTTTINNLNVTIGGNIPVVAAVNNVAAAVNGVTNYTPAPTTRTMAFALASLFALYMMQNMFYPLIEHPLLAMSTAAIGAGTYFRRGILNSLTIIEAPSINI